MKRLVRQLAAVGILCVASATGQSFTGLYSFNGLTGAVPRRALIQGTNGNLYGTAYYGGSYDSGTVFEITPGGKLTTLYSFCSQPNCADGANPAAGLIQASDGNFYGTSELGGANGYGTVFKMTPGGTLTTIYNFCSQSRCEDGEEPLAGLIQATDGNFYGTTTSGGLGLGGTVFRLTPAGALTRLYSFCPHGGCNDGETPVAALVQATNGDLYGTTDSGGPDGGGTVFKITLGGTLTTLYTFSCPESGCGGSASPRYGSLVQATGGDFYGTTTVGGANGYGTVFKMTPGGALTTIYSFCSDSGCTDGSSPWGGLAQADDGNLYGTTYTGGTEGFGTVFRVTPNGTLTTLHSFTSSDGSQPIGTPVQDTNGALYGTAAYGGSSADGTVFRISLGLSAFVETQTPSGAVGSPVKILGSVLAGATGVGFDGTPATFKVLSSTVIETTVPAGATSGAVQVVTPGGTLSSYPPFHVLP